jgi:hypothetical protein
MGWHTPKQPRRDSVRPDELAAYDRVVARQTSYGYLQAGTGYEQARKPEEAAGPYFGALLLSPLIADHISELGAVYRTRGEVEGSYRHQDREWVDIVLGRELGFNMWGHVADGMAVGVRPEAILALFDGREGDLEPGEKLLADYIRAFARGTVTLDQYRKIEQHFGARGAIEYSAFIGHLMMTIRLCMAFSGSRTPDEEIVRNVRAVIAREIKLPDSRARIPKLERVLPAILDSSVSEQPRQAISTKWLVPPEPPDG